MLIKQREYESAAAKLREALEIAADDERSYGAWNILANELVEAGRFEDATKCWQEAIEIGQRAKSKNRAIALRAWAGTLVSRKDYWPAAVNVREALEIEPEDERSYDAYNSLANALVKDGRFEEAAQRWQEAVAIGERAHSQKRTKVLCAWSQTLFERKNYERAAAKLREALEIAPDDERSCYSRRALAAVLRAWGEALTEGEDYERAAIKLREALELEPDDEQSYYAYNSLANALVKDGSFEEAAQRWQEAVDIGEKAQSTSRAIALRGWAGILTNQREYGRAAAKAREALAIEPDDKRSYVTYNSLANALVKDGSFDEAAQRWQEAVAIGERARS